MSKFCWGATPAKGPKVIKIIFDRVKKKYTITFTTSEVNIFKELDLEIRTIKLFTPRLNLRGCDLLNLTTLLPALGGVEGCVEAVTTFLYFIRGWNTHPSLCHFV